MRPVELAMILLRPGGRTSMREAGQPKKQYPLRSGGQALLDVPSWILISGQSFEARSVAILRTCTLAFRALEHLRHAYIYVWLHPPLSLSFQALLFSQLQSIKLVLLLCSS